MDITKNRRLKSVREMYGPNLRFHTIFVLLLGVVYRMHGCFGSKQREFDSPHPDHKDDIQTLQNAIHYLERK